MDHRAPVEAAATASTRSIARGVSRLGPLSQDYPPTSRPTSGLSPGSPIFSRTASLLNLPNDIVYRFFASVQCWVSCVERTRLSVTGVFQIKRCGQFEKFSARGLVPHRSAASRKESGSESSRRKPKAKCEARLARGFQKQLLSSAAARAARESGQGRGGARGRLRGRYGGV